MRGDKGEKVTYLFSYHRHQFSFYRLQQRKICFSTQEDYNYWGYA